MLGHWLAGSVTYHDGSFGRQNPLLDQPWTQWLTWLFQAVPTFFLVAGYAASVSWSHRRADDEMSRQKWVRRRLARVLGPSTAYVVLISACVVAFESTGASGSLLEYAGWAVAMHLWFLAVYLIVVSLTPIAIAAQRRWGLLVPAALALGVAAVDVASLAGHVPVSGMAELSALLGLLYQLGIAWQSGLLAGYRPALLGAGSACALGLLIWLGPYPVSMIGVPGQVVQNTEPPSLAMVAFGCAQAGLVIGLAPVVNRALRADCDSARAIASQHQRDGAVPVAHDSGGDRGGHRLSGGVAAATGRGRHRLVAGPVGMAGDPQPGDGVELACCGGGGGCSPRHWPALACSARAGLNL